MATDNQFVCYDIRGIQQYIFAVPNLKCIVGGSALIDRFDRETVKELADKHHMGLIFAGGGRGTLQGSASQAGPFIDALVQAAQELGLDIRIGESPDLEEASGRAQRLHAYVPEDLQGEPCRMSGLWPVPVSSRGGRFRDVHPIIARRLKLATSDPVGTRMLMDLRAAELLPAELLERFEQVSFMKNVNPDAEEPDDHDEQAQARLGQRALGSRNRWAILAMDGNDVGLQHRSALERFGADESKRWGTWLTTMSRSLRDCTLEAVVEGLGAVIKQWWSERGQKLFADNGTQSSIVLPFRPLLVGGDDLLILSHCSYALTLAQRISQAFERISRQKAQAEATAVGDLWPATGNRLTISAGLLYLGVSFPLAAGIRYAESLLASAKGRGRQSKVSGQPLPAAIDWEQLTESAIDTPQARRARELRFLDKDLGEAVEVRLTQRPWLLEDLEQWLIPLMQDLAEWEVPDSILLDLLTGLRQPYWDRTRHLLRLKKRQEKLWQLLEHDADMTSLTDRRGWQRESEKGGRRTVLSTPVLDAVLLYQETRRLAKETV